MVDAGVVLGNLPIPGVLCSAVEIAGFRGGGKVKWICFVGPPTERAGLLGSCWFSVQFPSSPWYHPVFLNKVCFANNSFQVLPGFLVPISNCGIKQTLLGGE